MSVKIRKKKEERNTPLWNFIGVALIPLLLAFVGGFSMGKTSFVDAQDYKEKYELEVSKNKTVQESVRKQKKLYTQLDALRKKAEDGFDELYKELIQAYNLDDDDLINNWEIDKAKEFKKWKKELGEIEVEFDDIKDSLNISNLRAINQTTEFLDNKSTILNKIKDHKAANKENGVISNLQDAGDALSQQITDLKADVTKKELKILEKEIEIKGLMNDLKAAANAAASGGGAPPPTSGKDNLKTAGEIVTKVQTLNQQIDTKMKAQFLGGKSKINILKAELKAELKAISGLAGRIE